MSVIVKPSGNKAAVVPNGTYPATLTSIKQFQNVYGDRLGFEFTLQGGQVDGAKVLRSTTPKLTDRSKLAELMRGLLGRELTLDELTTGMDIETLVGTNCNVLVLQSKGKNGHTYSNVERVFK